MQRPDPVTPLGRLAHPLLGLTLTLALGACSSLQGSGVDYRSARQGVALDVPPDLTQLSDRSSFLVPGSQGVSAKDFAGSQSTRLNTSDADLAANQLGDVRYERLGNTRWLHVNRPVEQLWDTVRDFWPANGFVVAKDEPKLGFMETDWAENRAKISDGFVRSVLGKLLDSLSSSGLRDKYRTRMERNPQGGTDIYITQRGLEEVYTDREKQGTAWQPRPNDPELEAEFLRRLMVTLGASPEQAKVQTAKAEQPGPNLLANAKVSQVNGQSVLQLDNDFERAWRRVGLALDRSGFSVEDRNRSDGSYFVRYVDPNVKPEDPGFFSRLFGGDSKHLPTARYQIKIKSVNSNSTVTVLDNQGMPATESDARNILQVLAKDL